MSSSAYLLVYHGSRDPRPEQAVRTLAHFFRQQIKINENQLSLHQSSNFTTTRLTTQESLVEVASLELAAIPLHQAILHLAQQAMNLGLMRLQIIPLFLLPGVHVKEDIPQEVILAELEIPKNLQLELKPHLGASSALMALLGQHFKSDPSEARILLSHGSRYPESSQAVEAVARQLNAIAAYWSVAPSLATQVELLLAQGVSQIAILPYFLFTGGIVQGIAQQVQQLQQAYPSLQLSLKEPINATPALAQVLLQLID